MGALGGAVNGKYMQLITDGGLTTFRSITDGGGILTNNILVMNHSSGNLCIGTTSPVGRLSVVEATAETDVNAFVRSNEASSYLTIQGAEAQGADNTSDAALRLAVHSAWGYTIGVDNSDGDKLKFDYGTGTVGASTALTLDQSGNVGIGTTSPAQPLHVLRSSGDAIAMISGTGATSSANLEIRSGSSAASIIDLTTGTTSESGPGTPDFSSRIMRQTGVNGVLEFTQTGTGDFAFSGGNVGIGTTLPTALLSVNGTADKPGGGSWDVFSDERLKKDISPFTDGLNVIDKINPVRFRYNGKAGITVQNTYVGVVAQHIQEIAPYTIKTVKMKMDTSDAEPTDILEFDPNALWYISINAIKELNDKIKTLEAENLTLKANYHREIAEIKALLGSSTKK